MEERALPDRRPRGRPTVGLLVESLGDAYQNSLFCGVFDRVKEIDANLVCFAGGVVEADRPDRWLRGAVFDLVGAECVDALVLASGPLSHVVGAEGLARYCERFAPLPVASISVPVPGMPSVGVDDTAGTREAIDHLIDVHGRRSIAFVRGPQSNKEAELRYQAYLEALAAHGIPPSEGRVVFGDFGPESAERAILAMSRERLVSLDAVVAANDLMAFGVMSALRTLGVRVPEDVAVIGFDDLEQARFSTPPLTTIRQPFRLLGATAVDVALSLLRGAPVSVRTLLPTRLIARRSCGCRSQLEASGRAGPPSSEGGRRGEEVDADRARFVRHVATMLGPAPTERERAVAERLVAALGRELRSETATGDGLLVALEEALRARLAAGAETGVFHEALAALHHQAAPRLRGDLTLRERIEVLFHHAHAVVGRYAETAQAEHRLRAEALTRALGEVSESLLTTFEAPTLLGSLSERLPRLGIPSAYLSAYADGSGEARLLFAFDSTAPAGGPRRGATFAPRALVPPGAVDPARGRAFVVEPLFFKEEPFGFGVFEAGPTDGIVYETLRDQISAAIKGADLVQKVVAHDRERRRMLRYMLDVTPEMHRVQPLGDLLQSILTHATEMLDHGASARPPDGFIAMLEDSRLGVRTGTGRFSDRSAVAPEVLAQAKSVLAEGTMRVTESSTFLPLTAGRELQIGVIGIDRAADEAGAELLAAFANQASAAIRSMQLYEMAALDPLTGVHARRFLDDWLEREIREAFRSHEPLTLLMVDMDQMKRINDTGGHLAGDEALATVGRVLRKNTRANDVVGRYGGDEFAVILPQTSLETGEAIGSRIVASMEDRAVTTPAGALSLRISVGLSSLAWQDRPDGAGDAKADSRYFHAMAQRLVGSADEALYRSKRAGGMQTTRGALLGW